MKTKRVLYGVVLAFGLTMLLTSSLTRVRAAASAPPKIDNDDIGGIVTSAKGPEAGVWVIAETTDLSTKFVRIVVTDDQGRYVVPDLPKASYKVWVRGYGLIDSKPVAATLGSTVNLTAMLAPSPRAAAQYYPANYWYTMINLPSANAFPMEKEGIQNQLDWVTRMKNDI